jgi:D-alanine-D-alanine ligase-like ATP-grasp enzyme
MRALNPSITVASGDVLTVEEKFQGGTGVNITPPPQDFVSTEVCAEAKRRIEMVAKVLGIGGYARIDAFLKIATGEILVIEANSLPGLTPSTVIFHQALSENPPLYPRAFLERIISQTGY